MNNKRTPHVRAGLALVLAGHTVHAAAAEAQCSIRALRMAMRAAGIPPLRGGRPKIKNP